MYIYASSDVSISISPKNPEWHPKGLLSMLKPVQLVEVPILAVSFSYDSPPQVQIFLEGQFMEDDGVQGLLWKGKTSEIKTSVICMCLGAKVSLRGHLDLYKA